MLTIGEVHTTILQHSTAVSSEAAATLLDLVRGARARQAERPMAYAVSPDTVAGLDCFLVTDTGARVRGIGTVMSRATLVGGHLIQGSTYARVERSAAGRRLTWSHYLARPGVIETLGRAAAEPLAAGYVRMKPGLDLVDLGAISARLIDTVQANPALDRRLHLKAARTRLRWAVPDGADPTLSIAFTLHGDAFRTVQVRAAADPPALAALCEDIALHDWLLTTLLVQVQRAEIGRQPRATVVARLRPSIDHLLHLWMPGLRVPPGLGALWDGLDRHPGLSRQWRVTVDRIRDQLALATIEGLGGVRST